MPVKPDHEPFNGAEDWYLGRHPELSDRQLAADCHRTVKAVRKRKAELAKDAPPKPNPLALHSEGGREVGAVMTKAGAAQPPCDDGGEQFRKRFANCMKPVR